MEPTVEEFYKSLSATYQELRRKSRAELKQLAKLRRQGDRGLIFNKGFCESQAWLLKCPNANIKFSISYGNSLENIDKYQMGAEVPLGFKCGDKHDNWRINSAKIDELNFLF